MYQVLDGNHFPLPTSGGGVVFSSALPPFASSGHTTNPGGLAPLLGNQLSPPLQTVNYGGVGGVPLFMDGRTASLASTPAAGHPQSPATPMMGMSTTTEGCGAAPLCYMLKGADGSMVLVAGVPPQPQQQPQQQQQPPSFLAPTSPMPPVLLGGSSTGVDLGALSGSNYPPPAYGGLPMMVSPAAVSMTGPALAPAPAPTRRNGQRYEVGVVYEGYVKRYNPVRGFGFLTATHRLPPPPASGKPATDGVTREAQSSTDQGLSATTTAVAEGAVPVQLGDIFVHQAYVDMCGFRALPVGARVRWTVGCLPGHHAPQATDVHLLPAAPAAAEGGGGSGAEAPATAVATWLRAVDAGAPQEADDADLIELSEEVLAALNADDEELSPSGDTDTCIHGPLHKHTLYSKAK
ncbi:hypothetical protein STCU_11390 [Strigomonas culicis]|uniref:CSD domain-containing protein n=1 Tax=Strigomonas culicis TaxID=28005 RepID=S9THD3_9TRYP|nr:hypothetical protein STCU_11390 [Strigomonas culicis]|eukprot:EPY16334.1 hypothetical protein STCU_11390 [Strigomonas culicis]